MKFKSEQTYDKLRGGYYTPRLVANFLTRWALGDGAKSLLEPSCGDGIFLEAAIAHKPRLDTIHGVELDPDEASKAQQRLGEDSTRRHVWAMDYLEFGDLLGERTYEAVVGNPPYIRYQFLEPETQKLAEDLYRRHNLPFTKHLNAWAPFVVDSLDRLSAGGRLAMIVPSELMNVIHAGALRRFLIEQCSRVLLVDTQTLIFDDALQGTVLLLAAKKAESSADSCELGIKYESDNAFLSAAPELLFSQTTFNARPVSSGKWMESLLTAEEQAVLAKVASLPSVHLFGDIAKVEVGIVTGANKFFLVPDSTVAKYDLQEFALPMFGRSFHCRGVVYSDDLHQENSDNGLATNFLHFGNRTLESLPVGAQKYIGEGQDQDLHLRYKCRIRSPWYDVPSVRSSSMSLLKRCHEIPRIIANRANALTTDTAYRVESKFSRETFAYSFVNSLTALSAEICGRTYGGGVLELVPSEIRSLLVPIVEATASELNALDGRLRDGDSVDVILESQDKWILESVGLTPADIEIVQGARKRLKNRRLRETSVL